MRGSLEKRDIAVAERRDAEKERCDSKMREPTATRSYKAHRSGRIIRQNHHADLHADLHASSSQQQAQRQSIHRFTDLWLRSQR